MSETAIDPSQYRLHENDTGSADYQVALLTERIKHLTKHLETHRKDFSSRRGLLRLVARRRNLLDFLKRDSEERYEKVVKGLGLRR
jgi:small subunit ribosomal protein S15